MIGAESFFVDQDGVRASRGTRIARVLIVNLFILIVPALTCAELVRARRESRWLPVPCTITSSVLARDPKIRDTPYSAAVTYTYAHHGATRTGEMAAVMTRTSDAAEAHATVRRFRAGDVTTCYVDPLDGANSTLTPTDSKRPLYALIACGFVIVGVWKWYCVPKLRTFAPPPSAERKRRSGYGVGAVLAIGGALTLAIAYAYPLLRNIRAMSWPTRRCTVLSRNVIRHTVGEYQFAHFRTDVLYRYEINGTEYCSNQYSLAEYGAFFTDAGKRAAIEAVPIHDADLKCFVNPNDPADAVLCHTVTPAVALAIFPIGLLVLGVRTMRKTRSATRFFDDVVRASRTGTVN